jgi:outer membrane protein assembly factor BamB
MGIAEGRRDAFNPPAMSESTPTDADPPRSGLRWWPAVAILVLAAGTVIGLRADGSASFQQRNLRSLSAVGIAGLLLFVWWLGFSRCRWKLRLLVAGLVVGSLGLGAMLFRIGGVTGDVAPIFEFRWGRHSPGPVSVPLQRAGGAGGAATVEGVAAADFPQFLGPQRTGILAGPALGRDWVGSPPQVLWRRTLGAAWSGWAVVGGRALTQEQRGEEECVTCYELASGDPIWTHADAVHYNTTIAGEGPRCTPTVADNRVYTLGATGRLNCLDLATGTVRWSRSITEDAQSRMPEWGFAGSPLICEGNVVVLAGGGGGRSLLAYRADGGEVAWSGGNASASYGSPFLAMVAGVKQILTFHPRTAAGHDPRTGRVLWEHPWGNGQPQAAVPLVVGTNRVLFSSGYGVGSVLLEIGAGPGGNLAATQVWKSNRLKAKFATLVQREGFVYGLDDGMLACLDLADGRSRWKEGRYGHGQGLLVRDLYVLMAENGELVLLRPTPESPNELQRFRVFSSKTWNPIALAGELLLCRNDREAACLRLPLERSGR